MTLLQYKQYSDLLSGSNLQIIKEAISTSTEMIKSPSLQQYCNEGDLSFQRAISHLSF